MNLRPKIDIQLLFWKIAKIYGYDNVGFQQRDYLELIFSIRGTVISSVYVAGHCPTIVKIPYFENEPANSRNERYLKEFLKYPAMGKSLVMLSNTAGVKLIEIMHPYESLESLLIRLDLEEKMNSCASL